MQRISMAADVEPMIESLRTRGLTASSVITEGDPKDALLAEAEQWKRIVRRSGCVVSWVERFCTPG